MTRTERRERGPWLGRLLVVTRVALPTWAASSAIPVITSVFGDDVVFPGDPSAEGFERTLYVLSAVSSDWIAATVAS